MFDLSRAPFHRRADATCSQVAEEMAACFELVSALRNKVTQVVRSSLFAIDLPLDEPIARAMLTMATEMDAGVGDGRANPYHNTQHFCEVMLSVLFLSGLDGMSTAGRARLLMAALAHDFHHDGRSSIGQPFRLERLAAQATMPYLNGAGVKREEQAQLSTLILATETTLGVPYARHCLQHAAEGNPPPPSPELESQLGVLAQNPELARQAVILAEADLLPSVGLTVYLGELTQANLSKEWGRPMTAVDKLFFLEKVFGDFTVGTFFSPNVQALKAAMQRKVEAIRR